MKAQVKKESLNWMELAREVSGSLGRACSNGFDEKLELTRDLRNRISKAILDDMDGVKKTLLTA